MTTLITETQFQQTIIEAVRAIGGMIYHAHDSRRQVRKGDGYALVGDQDAKGYPDLTIAVPGREVIWAELKRGKRDKATPEQSMWLDTLPPHRAFLWRVEDWDDAWRIIQYGHCRSGAITAGNEEVNGPPVRRITPDDYERTCWACNRV